MGPKHLWTRIGTKIYLIPGVLESWTIQVTSSHLWSKGLVMVEVVRVADSSVIHLGWREGGGWRRWSRRKWRKKGRRRRKWRKKWRRRSAHLLNDVFEHDPAGPVPQPPPHHLRRVGRVEELLEEGVSTSNTSITSSTILLQHHPPPAPSSTSTIHGSHLDAIVIGLHHPGHRLELVPIVVVQQVAHRRVDLGVVMEEEE